MLPHADAKFVSFSLSDVFKIKKKIHVSLTGNLFFNLVICFNKGILLWLHSLYRIYQQKQQLMRKALSFFILSYNVKQLKRTHNLNITMHYALSAQCSTCSLHFRLHCHHHWKSWLHQENAFDSNFYKNFSKNKIHFQSASI